ncbi:hypothetical protein BDN72DRAFT_898156 [Pluteus cervinus]|uniref:Uncharacterized protein n=1 Tax=Pluteus cervinus TaxID=181527 RepID=A0ACD3AR23_9AGAR|nr:hypothetical protein BDN72DRAFT_898156 [Pluteus cervinus]
MTGAEEAGSRTHELEDAEPRRCFPQQHDIRLIPHGLYAPQLPAPQATQRDCWSVPNGRVPNHAFEILSEHPDAVDLAIQLQVIEGMDHRCYNLPIADEVAMILPGGPNAETTHQCFNSSCVNRLTVLFSVFCSLCITGTIKIILIYLHPV